MGGLSCHYDTVLGHQQIRQRIVITWVTTLCSPFTVYQLYFPYTCINILFLKNRSLFWSILFNLCASEVHFYFTGVPRRIVFRHKGFIDIKEFWILLFYCYPWCFQLSVLFSRVTWCSVIVSRFLARHIRSQTKSTWGMWCFHYPS
jgi:hypothetical protein